MVAPVLLTVRPELPKAAALLNIVLLLTIRSPPPSDAGEPSLYMIDALTPLFSIAMLPDTWFEEMYSELFTPLVLPRTPPAVPPALSEILLPVIQMLPTVDSRYAPPVPASDVLPRMLLLDNTRLPVFFA